MPPFRSSIDLFIDWPENRLSPVLAYPDECRSTHRHRILSSSKVARLVREKLERRYVSWPNAERQAELASEWEAETDMR